MKNKTKEDKKEEFQEELYNLLYKIEEAAFYATDQIENALYYVIYNPFRSPHAKGSKIRNASIKEIHELINFYYSCENAASTSQVTNNSKRSKIYKLSNPELRSKTVKKYIDKNLSNLLYKYNKLISNK